jgi:hypothetical protein
MVAIHERNFNNYKINSKRQGHRVHIFLVEHGFESINPLKACVLEISRVFEKHTAFIELWLLPFGAELH